MNERSFSRYTQRLILLHQARASYQGRAWPTLNFLRVQNEPHASSGTVLALIRMSSICLASREGIDRIGGVGERKGRGGLGRGIHARHRPCHTRHKLWRARHNMRCVIILTGIRQTLDGCQHSFQTVRLLYSQDVQAERAFAGKTQHMV